jgi:formate dehydrogenase major subunit
VKGPSTEFDDRYSRRSFFKFVGAAGVSALALEAVSKEQEPRRFVPTKEKMRAYELGKRVPSICTYCAGGCGMIVTSIGGKAVEIEGDVEHPVNGGALCSKASAYIQLVNSDRRLLEPMKRTNPRKGTDQDPGWARISWDEAFEIIASKVAETMANARFTHEENIGGRTVTNYYYVGKDHPIGWHGSSYWNNEECYLGKKFISLLGSMNVEHQARKCHASTVAALANTFGFGAMTNHVIDAKNSKVFLIMSNPVESHTLEFKWVQMARDNGAKIIVLDPRYNRTASKADIFGHYRSGGEAAIFLGLIRYALFEKPQYVNWNFLENRTNAPYDLDGKELSDWRDNPNSIIGKLKSQVSKYTPDEVQRISGLSKEKLVAVAETFMSNKPSNIYYSMGTTQHTNATQAIRAQAILQLLLGNMGVPGGGVNALRGINNVQGSTDMNLLSHLIMGYRTTPRNTKDVRRYQKWKNTDAANRGGVQGGATYAPKDKIEERWDARHFGHWKNLQYNWGLYVGTWPGYDPDNEPVICDLPMGTGNATMQIFRAIRDGMIKVMFIVGENNAVSNANSNLIRSALSKEDLFLVVNEIFETETAHYADIILPGTTIAEREGSVTNTGRWVQWRWKASEPPGQTRDELWFVTQLYRRIRARGTAKLPSELSGLPIGANPDETWPSPWRYELGDTAEAVYKEIGHPTLWGNVLYKTSWDDTIRPDLGGVLAKRRDKTPASDQDAKYGFFKNWAWSWMGNQRVLYNIDEDPSGLNTFFVWWAHNSETWLGLDRAAIWSRGLTKPDKPDWNPLKHGMPLHNEPLESPDRELAAEYPSMWDGRFEVTVGGPDEYPHVLTTFRLAEHMQAGAMTRNLPWLVETHPEMFVEMSPALAAELGIGSGEYVVVKTARHPDGAKMKAIVTERLAPMTVNGKTVHEVAMPWHWGFKGLSTGPSANLLTMDAVDSSANIPETKACLCRVEKA